MKKILSFFAVMILVSVSLHAQVSYKINENTYQKISISFAFGDVKTMDVKTDEGYFSRIYIDGCGGSNNVGNPELPVSVNMLEIPIFGDYVLNVYGKDFVIYDAKALGINYPIYPAQPSVSKSHRGQVEFIQNKNMYQTDAFYALPLAQFEEVGIMRNVNLGTLYVNPVQYNPVTNEIKVYTSIDVEILFKKVEFVRTQAVRDLHKSPLFRPSNIINPMKGSKAEFSNVPVKYLIVAHAMFRDALDEFMAWKKRKGFIVEIGYTDDPNVGATTTSIANFIKSHYTDATPENPAPTFVLLVGDVQQIPAFQVVTIDPHPTDLYYFTWNGGNIPCCYYGRFSAQNLGHLIPQIEKTLQYEQFTMPDPSYLDNICLIAGHDNNYAPTFGNGFVNYTTQNYANTAYGYTNVYAHFHPCSNQAAQIRTEIGNGVGIANYTAHCDWDGWSQPAFLVGHVAVMNNLNKYGLMIGSCCFSNKFDANECFGEALLRATGKGAVGYIGGSDYTYWYEDYYWSIGARSSISVNPTYDPTRLGAYDRLFHTHGETYDKWMTTFGSMITAGNEAVQASSSGATYKKYYWEIYHLMGDPSLMTYLTQPSQMAVELPGVIVVGVNTLTAKVAPYAYCALTNEEGELISAGFADADGNITLNFNPIGVPGEYEFAAWAQKYIQYFQTIQCIVPEGSFVTGTATLATASIPYNGASVYFDVTLKNIGVANASNIQISISTESNEVTIVNNVTSIPALAAGEERTLSNIFLTNIQDYVQDGTPIMLSLNVVSDNNSFQKSIKMVLQAPRLAVTGSNVSKVSGTGPIAPGDEVNIEFELSNIGHNTIFDVFTTASVYYSGFELFTDQQTVTEIVAGGNKKVTFTGKVGTFVENGALIPVYFSALKGIYTTEGTGAIVVGTAMEDFETGDFSKFAWIQGEHPWEITTSNVYQGVYSARSKTNLGHNNTSQLKMTTYVPVASNVSYARRVSSEQGYDFFRFYIDNTQKEQLSGTAGNWGTASFAVEPGIRTFTFEYSKDPSQNSGSDCAWIDNITIPGMGSMVNEDLPKLKVLNHTVEADMENDIIIPGFPIQITFDLKNIGSANASNIIGVLLSNGDFPIAKITAEGSDSNETLPFSMEAGEEKFIMFEVLTYAPLKWWEEIGYIELMLEVKSGNHTIYYPIVLTYAWWSNISHHKLMSCTLYPNPAHTTLMIETENQISSYEIMDMTGRVMTSKQNINNNRTQANVTSLAAGMYFVKVIDNEQRIAVQKFVKQ